MILLVKRLILIYFLTNYTIFTNCSYLLLLRTIFRMFEFLNKNYSSLVIDSEIYEIYKNNTIYNSEISVIVTYSMSTKYILFSQYLKTSYPSSETTKDEHSISLFCQLVYFYFVIFS